jgi:uncharacterized membrane-anchored protein
LLLAAVFVGTLRAQLRSRRYHPALYWTVILSTSTVGTELSDFLNRTLKLGYPTGALLLLTALGAVFAAWRATGTTFDVAHIDTPRGEWLYWAAILLSNTLGTSLGDFTADDLHLGFGPAALLFGGLLAALLLARRQPRVPATLLFWSAFVLTRPLGATTGDFFSKPHRLGGLGYGPTAASAALTIVLVALIAYQLLRRRDLSRVPDTVGS